MSAGPHKDTFWTDERVDRLKIMCAEGCSFSQIGEDLGCTRNAAIGKAGRMGIAKNKRTTPPKPRARSKRAARNVNGRALKIVEIMEQAYPELPLTEPINPATIVDLKDGQCHWPCSGEGVATIFCGGEAVAGLPYCAAHCRIAYRSPERRMSRAEFQARGRELARKYKPSAAA